MHVQSKKNLIAVGILSLILVLGGLLYYGLYGTAWRGMEPEPSADDNASGGQAENAFEEPLRRGSTAGTDGAARKEDFLERMNKRKAQGHHHKRGDRGGTEMSVQEALLIEEAVHASERLNELLDMDDLAGALSEARLLLSHTNAEVRLMACQALDWIGADAVVDLAGLLTDEDARIAEAARESFRQQLDELPDDDAKLQLLKGLVDCSDDSMRIELAEVLSEFHVYVAFDPLLTLWEASGAAAREDVLWELEAVTGESYERADEWRSWFTQHRDELEEDYLLELEVDR